jgi:hypothetical protein
VDRPAVEEVDLAQTGNEVTRASVDALVDCVLQLTHVRQVELTFERDYVDWHHLA